MIKVCSKCGEAKELTHFYKRREMSDGYRNSCKKCWIKSGKIYKENNIFGDKKKKYYKLLKNGLKVCNGCGKTKKIEDYWKSLDSRCKECYKKDNERRYLENRETRILKAREYRKTHKDKRKRLNTLQDHISSRVSSAVRYSLKRVGKSKNNRKWENILGYGAKELIEHFGINTIEDLSNNSIDHIIPISAYDYKSIEDDEFKKCWNINNLRLISIAENSSKINKIDVNLIKECSIEHLLPGRIALRH